VIGVAGRRNIDFKFWFKESTLHSPPRKPKPPLTLAGLPSECKQIVRAP
jgi:penicillin-insensitive murein endopeptidase